MRSAVQDFLRGVGDLGRGFGYWATSPRLMLLGAIPALVVGIVWAALLLWLFVSIDALAAAATSFADGWSEPWRTGIRVLVGLVIVAAALAVAVLSFTAVVLTVGDPFYERISGAVDRRMGEAPPERDEPFLRGVVRALGDGLRLFLAGLLVGLVVLLLGLIPIVGAVLGFVAGAVLGGRLLAVELTGWPFDTRGHSLAERRRTLARSRARTLGFGVATWLVFLIPFAAVVAMPAAVGGAAALSRAALARASAGTEATIERQERP